MEYQAGWKIHDVACAPLTIGPPWLTTLATPDVRLEADVPVAVSSPALVVNDEPAVPRPTTPPPRARNASSAARLGAVSVFGFSVPPTTSTSTSAVSTVLSVAAVAARLSKPT